jgi:hypothetical protein
MVKIFSITPIKIPNARHFIFNFTNGFYEPFVLYTDGNGDYITAYEYEKGFPGYRRIGQYTFAQAVQVPQSVQVPKIDKLIYTDETAILWKLNELVDAVNELRMRDAKESKDD